MNIPSFFKKILSSFEDFGYARAAFELQHMSDAQLVSLGISRKKLEQGRAGLPWTIDRTPDSVVIHSVATVKAANQDHFQQHNAA